MAPRDASRRVVLEVAVAEPFGVELLHIRGAARRRAAGFVVREPRARVDVLEVERQVMLLRRYLGRAVQPMTPTTRRAARGHVFVTRAEDFGQGLGALHRFLHEGQQRRRLVGHRAPEPAAEDRVARHATPQRARIVVVAVTGVVVVGGVLELVAIIDAVRLGQVKEAHVHHAELAPARDISGVVVLVLAPLQLT